MKNKIVIGVSFVALIVSACQRTETMRKFSPEKEETWVHAMQLPLEVSGVFNPLYLKVSDSVLLIVEDSGEPLIKVLNAEGELLEAWGKKGRGPEEFLQIASVDLLPSGQTLCSGIYDASRKRYMEVSGVADSASRCVKEVWSSDKNFDMVGRLSGDCYVGSVVFDSSRFYLLDSFGRIKDRIANFPPKPDGIPLLSHSMASSGVLAVAPHDPIFASCVAYDGGVDVCEVRNGKIEPLWRFSQFDMDYDILPEYHNTPTPNSHSRTGYVALCFSSNYLYALYSGRKTLDEDSELCDEIHLFDYRGRQCKRYRLDRKIYELGVDKNDRRLFGLTKNADGVAELVVYNIE